MSENTRFWGLPQKPKNHQKPGQLRCARNLTPRRSAILSSKNEHLVGFYQGPCRSHAQDHFFTI